MVGCSVLGCKSRSERNINGITFHKFPSHVDVKLKWVMATGRKNWKPTKYTKMCSLHFSGDDFDLINQRVQIKKTAVPMQHVHCAIMSEQDYNDNQTDDIYPVAECRACLQILYSDSILWNIFEPWNGMENSIAEDLIRLANIQISETDQHSKVICETCYQVLLGACHFIACVRKNDQLLLERYPCKSHQNLDDKVWPKPIQVDKIIHSSMFLNPMIIEVKQEVQFEDKYTTFNGTFDDNKDDILNLDIKIEPEEIQQSTQVNINGSISPAIAPEKGDVQTNVTYGNTNSELNDLRADVKEEPQSDDYSDPLSSDLSLQQQYALQCMLEEKHKELKRKRNRERQRAYYHRQKILKEIEEKQKELKKELKRKRNCERQRAYYHRQKNLKKNEEKKKKVPKTNAERQREFRQRKADKSYVDMPQTRRTNPRRFDKSKELQCVQCNETFSDIYYLKIHQKKHHCIPRKDIKNEVESMEVDSPKRICTRNKKIIENRTKL